SVQTVHYSWISSTPDNHFAAGPQCRVRPSYRGRVDGASGDPTVCARIVSPAAVKKAMAEVVSTPDDHLGAAPYCGVKGSCDRRIGGAGSGPTVGKWIVPAAGVNKVVSTSTPDNHFTASP